MSKPVDKHQFWAERIRDAVELRQSVYYTSRGAWDHLNETHREIMGQHLTGKILDAGCGYGRWSELFAASDYLGIDFSPDFIHIAKDLYPSKAFEVADLKALLYPDKTFDWAFCVSIRQMIRGNLGEEVWAQMESELKRVAKHVLILEYTDPEVFEVL